MLVLTALKHFILCMLTMATTKAEAVFLKTYPRFNSEISIYSMASSIIYFFDTTHQRKHFHVPV